MSSTLIHQQRQPNEVGRPAPGPRPYTAHFGMAPSPKREVIAPARVLESVTRRGRLVLAPTAEDLEFETTDGRFELLGPYGTEAHEGDEVEITGLPDPTARHPHTLPALLIQQMRRI